MDSGNEKNEMLELKNKLDMLARKLDSQPEKKISEEINIKRELQDLKNKYVFLLENMVRLQAQEQRKFPKEVSNQNLASETRVSELGDVQILMLLKQSKATSREFAVTSKQLKKAFSIKKSERTVRNKLNYLEQHNLVLSFGKKPKLYYLTPSGVSIAEKHNKTALFPNKEL